MRGIIIFCALIAATVANQQFASKRITTTKFEKHTDPKLSALIVGQFTTKLDHFRPRDLRSVNLTYYKNAEYYQPGGPLYIYFKAIGDVSTQYIEDGLMVQLAQQHHATLLTFNYRYFGDNRLFDDLTWENYQFLTIEQIVADAGAFIDYARFTHGFAKNIVVWGSRFGATVAAYARQKYPHLVNGAWSSSGSFGLYPVSFDYYGIIRFTLLSGDSENCADRVYDAINELNALITIESGENLQNRLNLCRPLETNDLADVASLTEKWIDILSDFIEQYHIHGVISFCNDIESSTSDALDSLSRWINFVSNSDQTCFDHSYNDIVDQLSNSTLIDGADRRTWFYFQCTQAGYFKISSEVTWLQLHTTYEYRMKLCSDILGTEFNSDNLQEAIINARVEFGSYAQFMTEVIYTNGLIDPWLYDNAVYSPNAYSYVIQYASASSDLDEARGWDTMPIVQIKQLITEHVNLWSNKY